MAEDFQKTIGGHVFSVAPFTGAKAEATARVLLAELGQITSSRLGIQGENFARSVNAAAFSRIEAALRNSDFVSVAENGEGVMQPLTSARWDRLVAGELRLPVLMFIAQAVYAPETLSA